MRSTSDIINALGSETIQQLCGVGKYSVRAAKRDGLFPASWFDLIDSECAKKGIPCPRSLFAFKGAA